MRKSLKEIASIVLLLVLILSITACSSKTNEIKRLTEEFENSCNKLDFNAMLDCINPEVADGVRLATGIVGLFADKDTDELLDSFAKVLFSELPENSKEFFSSIKIKLDNVEMEENNASASAEIIYEISGEENKSNANFEYVCVDEKWYISNLNME